MESATLKSKLVDWLTYLIAGIAACFIWLIFRLFPLILLGLGALLSIGLLAFFGAWPSFWPAAIGPTVLLSWALWHWFWRPADVRAQTLEAVTILVKCTVHILLLRACYELFSEPKSAANLLSLVVGTFSALIIHEGHKRTMHIAAELEVSESDLPVATRNLV
ncbi:MAG: hypothetical protein ABL949_01360 [Fimbriimonadaceae bacterium]